MVWKEGERIWKSWVAVKGKVRWEGKGWSVGVGLSACEVVIGRVVGGWMGGLVGVRKGSEV